MEQTRERKQEYSITRLFLMVFALPGTKIQRKNAIAHKKINRPRKK